MTTHATDVRDVDRTVLITGGIAPRVVVPPHPAGRAGSEEAAAEFSRGPADWRVELLGSRAQACDSPW